MKDNMELVDISEKKQPDKFIRGIIISLVVLVILGLLLYFFGYNIFKGFIKV